MSLPFERAPSVIFGTLRPLRDGLLVEPLDWEPSKVLDIVRYGRPLRGIVRATGPGAFQKRYLKNDQGQRCGYKDTSIFVPVEVKPGQLVELGGLDAFDGKGYDFQEVIVGGKRHLLCTEKDVCAVHDGPPQ